MVIEEVEEIPEGDVVMNCGGYIVEEIDDREWYLSDQDMVVFMPLVEEPVTDEHKEADEKVSQGDGSGRPSIPVEEPQVEESIPSELVDGDEDAQPVKSSDDQFSSRVEVSQGETSDLGVMSPILEALRQLEVMEKIIPAKKRSLAESSEGQKEVIQVESLDEEEETLTSRKKRKFASAKGKSQPVKWSSRKMSTVKKEEPKPEPKTPCTSEAKNKNPSGSSGKIQRDIG